MKESQQSAVSSLQSAFDTLGLRRRRRSNPAYGVTEQQVGTPTKVEDQSRTRSVGTPVDSQQFEATPKEEDQSRTRSVGTAGNQSSVSSPQSSVSDAQASAQHAQSKTSGQKGGKSVLKGLISGTMISDSLILKDIKYSALILILGIIFIAIRFSAERVEREIAVLEQEVRDMRAEALSVSADLGSVSRQSEITDLVKERGLGLEELREPPYRIVVNE